jgi:hypothetical protein
MHESLLHYGCFCWPRYWKFTTNSGYLQRGKKPQCSRSVVEAIDPFKWAPTSVPNTYNKLCFTTFICCGCAYEWVLTTTAHLVGLAFECSPEYVLPLEGQTAATCGDWGCITIQVGSQIHANHMRGVIQPSHHAVGESLPCYKFSSNSETSWCATNHSVEQCGTIWGCRPN